MIKLHNGYTNVIIPPNTRLTPGTVVRFRNNTNSNINVIYDFSSSRINSADYFVVATPAYLPWFQSSGLLAPISEHHADQNFSVKISEDIGVDFFTILFALVSATYNSIILIINTRKNYTDQRQCRILSKDTAVCVISQLQFIDWVNAGLVSSPDTVRDLASIMKFSTKIIELYLLFNGFCTEDSLWGEKKGATSAEYKKILEKKIYYRGITYKHLMKISHCDIKDDQDEDEDQEDEDQDEDHYDEDG